MMKVHEVQNRFSVRSVSRQQLLMSVLQALLTAQA